MCWDISYVWKRRMGVIAKFYKMAQFQAIQRIKNGYWYSNGTGSKKEYLK